MPNYTVSAGQTSSGITLNVVDSETVLSGGTSIDTTVNGGTLNVYAGGSDSSTTINKPRW